MAVKSYSDLFPWFSLNISNNWNWQATTVIATLFGSILYFIGNNQKRQKKAIERSRGIDRNNHSIEIGNTGVYKSSLLDEKHETLETFYPEANTLYHTFLKGMEISKNGKCVGNRQKRRTGPYSFLSYAEVFKSSRNLGSNMIVKLGVKAGNETKFGIYARNCPEWFISALACIRYSMVIVPLYDTLGAEAATFIIKHTELEIVIVDNAEKAKRLLSNREETPCLKHIVIVDNESICEIPEEDLHGIQLHQFEDLLEIKESEIVADVPPKPDDIYIICYTSGTTGTPKGVVLTHRNVVANISAFAFMLNKFLPEMFDESQQTIISYLPLSHMFEQTCHWCTMMLGGCIGYISGDVTDLSDDLQELKPTIFPVVPRLLNRLNDTIKSQLRKSSKVSQFVFNMAYKRKLQNLKNGFITSIFDKIVFRKAQNQLGGRVKVIVVGSAPTSPQVLESCRIVFGCHIIEAYGQTESTALATCTWPGESEGGHCGGTSTCANLKLEDVPDLNYFAKDRKGEILLKGPSITKGYYKDPEKTAELFDSEGFLHTGDIGHLLPNGKIKIIDRKKHIFKLAQGEYVAPEKIENVYIQSDYVQQIYVDGDSLERFLVAIVIPVEKSVRWLYKELNPNKNSNNSLEEICKDKKVIDHIFKDMQKLGKSLNLNSIEQVKAIYIDTELFSVENGLLTPTLKSKRPQLRLKYKEIMTNLYKNTNF